MSRNYTCIRKFLAVLTVVASTLSCGFAAESPLIKGIKINSRGEASMDESFVTSLISSQVGKPVDNKIVSSDVRRLLDSKRFAYVGTQINDVPGGVQLVFIVERRLRITGKIEFEGRDALRQTRVLEAIGLAAGDFADEQIIGAAAERLKKEYIVKRYFDVVVKPVLTPIENNPGAARLKFVIDEGVRNKVEMIDINGNDAIKDRTLRRVSGQSPWWNPSGWFSDQRVSDFDLELMKSDMRKQYMDMGYLDVEISNPLKIKEGHTWNIRFDVKEGPVYKVGEIEFEDITLFSEDMVLASITLKKGDVAGLTSIDDARNSAREFFSSRGYVDTRVQTSTYPDETHPATLNIVFTVKEGALAHVRNILVRGNTSTKDKVIRREILLNPGEIYNGVIAERSQKRLKNLGYFSEVRNYDLSVDEETRDLVYEVEEQSTGSMMLGAGFSSVDHLIGMFEISQSNFDITNFRNFRGAGQKTRLSLQVSSDSTDIEASFIEPWFMDRRLALEVTGFMRNRSYSEYDEQREGLTVGLSKHVPWIGRIGLSYTIQQVSMDDVIKDQFYFADDPETTYAYTDEDDSYLLSSARLSWTYDTRDNPMIPQSGTRATAYATLYNSALGSDYDIYELDTKWKNYQSLWYRHVISFSAHASVIDSYADDDVPIGSRYFLGGSRSARGFRYRNIGPKALPVDGDGTSFRPVGGRSLFDASIEYTIPIVKVLRFAVFYDVGNVWADPYEFDFSEYASSVGAGIRLDIPGFPVRLDFANALKKDDDLTRERSFVFWIGFDN